jgi:hypothetical protein
MQAHVHFVARAAPGNRRRVSHCGQRSAQSVTSVPMRRPLRQCETEIRPGVRARAWFLLPGQAIQPPGAAAG